MPKYHAHAGSRLSAAPERVYALLADYLTEHPAIVPRPPFTVFEIVEGGIGNGTVLEIGMKVLGKERRTRGVVSEPERGRILAETYEDPIAGTTTFTVEKSEDGGSFLTIATRGKTPHEGFFGRLEELFLNWYLGSVYRRELQLIEVRSKGT